MELIEVFKSGGPFAFLQMFGLVIGAIWCLIPAVLLGMRWKVPPVIAAVPLALYPLVAAMGSSWAWSRIQEAARAIPEEQTALIAAGIGESLAHPTMLMVAVIPSMILGIGGLAAGFRPPRAGLVPGSVLLIAGCAGLLPVGGLLATLADVPFSELTRYESPLMVIVRSGLYLLGAIPLALAFSNAHPHGNGPEGGTTAAVAWIGFVGAVELSTGAIQAAGLFGSAATMAPAERADWMRTLLEVLDTRITSQWLILLAAGIPALISVLREGPDLTEKEILESSVNPSPWRALGRLLAVGIWLCWMLALWSCSPLPALEYAIKTMTR